MPILKNILKAKKISELYIDAAKSEAEKELMDSLNSSDEVQEARDEAKKIVADAKKLADNKVKSAVEEARKRKEAEQKSEYIKGLREAEATIKRAISSETSEKK